MERIKNTDTSKDIEAIILEIIKLNDIEKVKESLTLLNKLINNVIKNPNDPKFCQFNKNNDHVKNKVLNIKNMDKLLSSIGYKESEENPSTLILEKSKNIELSDISIILDRSLIQIEKTKNKLNTNEPELEEGSLPVTLYVYDLTNGMASTYGPMLIGKRIEGVWHTGICVFNTEYFFGGGICQSKPKLSPYGKPVKEIKLGGTFITKDLFEEFLKEIRDKYSANTYNLLHNNCNHFTNACAEFLTGNGIPKDILNQHEVLLNTPMGSMLMPYLQNMGSNSVPNMFEGKK